MQGTDESAYLARDARDTCRGRRSPKYARAKGHYVQAPSAVMCGQLKAISAAMCDKYKSTDSLSHPIIFRSHAVQLSL